MCSYFLSSRWLTRPAESIVWRFVVLRRGTIFCGCADFATNRLGTCKHIEFMLAALEKEHGGATAFKVGYAPSFSEIYVYYGQQRSLRIRVGADCPAPLRKYFESVTEPVTGELPVSAIAAIDPMIKAAQHAAHELRCYDDALAMVATYRNDNSRRNALAAAYSKADQSSALKTLLKTSCIPINWRARGFWPTWGARCWGMTWDWAKRCRHWPPPRC